MGKRYWLRCGESRFSAIHTCLCHCTVKLHQDLHIWRLCRPNLHLIKHGRCRVQLSFQTAPSEQRKMQCTRSGTRLHPSLRNSAIGMCRTTQRHVDFASCVIACSRHRANQISDRALQAYPWGHLTLLVARLALRSSDTASASHRCNIELPSGESLAQNPSMSRIAMIMKSNKSCPRS